jgi:hypothetical protein
MATRKKTAAGHRGGSARRKAGPGAKRTRKPGRKAPPKSKLTPQPRPPSKRDTAGRGRGAAGQRVAAVAAPSKAEAVDQAVHEQLRADGKPTDNATKTMEDLGYSRETMTMALLGVTRRLKRLGFAFAFDPEFVTKALKDTIPALEADIYDRTT